MRQKITSSHWHDAQGLGGEASALGVEVRWQHGPITVPARAKGIVDEDCQGANGAFVEGLIQIAIDRLRFYQEAEGGKHANRGNDLALVKLEEALHWLENRN